MSTNNKVGLIFSGGGARGAFQIGCWKALKEMGITDNIVAVFGTSVGAINSAAFLQNDLALAEEIWNILSYEKVFKKLPDPNRKKFSRKFYAIARQVIKEKGLDVSPLKELIRSHLDEKIIRESSLDMGLVVFDWTIKRPHYLLKNEIPDDKLIEFVIASSTFPVFQPHQIGDHVYIDGGVFDNRPLSFCENREDFDKIICIDVTIARHFWPNKKRKMSDRIVFIRPSRLLGSPMAFDTRRIKRNIELGYEDTLRQLTNEEIMILNE